MSHIKPSKFALWGSQHWNTARNAIAILGAVSLITGWSGATLADKFWPSLASAIDGDTLQAALFWLGILLLAVAFIGAPLFNFVSARIVVRWRHLQAAIPAEEQAQLETLERRRDEYLSKRLYRHAREVNKQMRVVKDLGLWKTSRERPESSDEEEPPNDMPVVQPEPDELTRTRLLTVTNLIGRGRILRLVEARPGPDPLTRRYEPTRAATESISRSIRGAFAPQEVNAWLKDVAYFVISSYPELQQRIVQQGFTRTDSAEVIAAIDRNMAVLREIRDTL